MTSSAPALSVILATPSSFESLRRTVGHLRAQTVKERLEIVLVGPSREALRGGEEALSGFWGHQLLGVGPIRSLAQANAAAVGAARAPLVAFAEDHCFPEPGWAAALIEAHKGPWAAVAPAITNANPGTAVSWCDLLIGYGPWLDPVPRGVTPFLPGHNSCYKRSVLLEYGTDLEAMLEAETVLHYDLVRRGRRLLIEPEARAAHTNFGLLAPWLLVMYLQGRVFASARSRLWGPARRLAWTAASPLIPVLRLARCLSHLRRGGRRAPSAVRLLPVLGLGLICDGLGQMAGYLTGSGRAVERLARYEFHRFRYLSPADGEVLQATPP